MVGLKTRVPMNQSFFFRRRPQWVELCAAHFTRTKVCVGHNSGTVGSWVRCVLAREQCSVRNTASNWAPAICLSFLSLAYPPGWGSLDCRRTPTVLDTHLSWVLLCLNNHRHPRRQVQLVDWLSVCGMLIQLQGLYRLTVGGFYPFDYDGAGSLYIGSGVTVDQGTVVHGGLGNPYTNKQAPT